MKNKNKKIEKYLSESTYLTGSRGNYLWFTYNTAKLKNQTTDKVAKNLEKVIDKIEPIIKKLEKDINKTWQYENMKIKFL